MRVGWAVWVVAFGAVGFGAGCNEPPPNLLTELDGAWVGTFDQALGSVPAEATFVWSEDDEALTGEVVWQADGAGAGERGFDLLDAVSVEDVGVGLALIEQGSVHELYLDALAPLDPYVGAWREEWYCGTGDPAADAAGFCEIVGGFSLRRR